MSPLTCHFSYIACHLSPVTNMNSHNHRPSPANFPTLHSKVVIYIKIGLNLRSSSWRKYSKKLQLLFLNRPGMGAFQRILRKIDINCLNTMLLIREAVTKEKVQPSPKCFGLHILRSSIFGQNSKGKVGGGWFRILPKD